MEKGLFQKMINKKPVSYKGNVKIQCKVQKQTEQPILIAFQLTGKIINVLK